MFGSASSLTSLRILTTDELSALRTVVVTELTTKGGKYIASATSGDVSVTKMYGVTLGDLLNAIDYEMQRRGLSTARITRTNVRFS